MYVYIPPEYDTFIHLPYSGCSFPINEFKTYVNLIDNIDPQFKTDVMDTASRLIKTMAENKSDSVYSWANMSEQIPDFTMKSLILQRLIDCGNIKRKQGTRNYVLVSHDLPDDFCNYQMYIRYQFENQVSDKDEDEDEE